MNPRFALLAACLAGLVPVGPTAQDCPSPILPGRWNLRALAVTNRFEGRAVIEGLLTTIEGQVTSTAIPSGTYFGVDCSGAITNGHGRDLIGGTLVQREEGLGVSVTTTTRYSGDETYTYTGHVVVGANGLPELQLDVQVIAGSTTAQGETVAITPVGTFSQPFGGTESLAGQRLTLRLPVLRYDAQAGVIEVDMKQSPWFQQSQALVDALLQGNPLNLTIAYSGSAAYENASLSLDSVTPSYTQYFLKNIPAMNTFTAAVSWRNTTPPREVLFRYGTEQVSDIGGAPTATADFDMGEPPDRVVVTASAPEDTDGPEIVELKKVDVSPWARSAGLSGAPGIVYQGNAHWPPLPGINTMFGNAPIVGGLWSLFSHGRNDCFIKAYSQGPPAGDGDLDWFYRLGVPFTSYQMEFALKGKTSTTLNERGLKLTGNADLAPFVWQGSKNVGLPELVPGLRGAACGFSSRLCNMLHGIGVEGTLTFTAGGRGTFSADESDPKIEWDTGTGTFKLRGQLTLSIAPPPIEDILSARIWGAGTACLELKFHPEIAVDRFGAELEVGYGLTLIGFEVASDTHRWPVVGNGCGPGPPFALHGASRHAQNPPASGVPTDGQARVALGPDGRFATVWSGRAGTHARPSGDIFLQLSHGGIPAAPIRLTDDPAADRSPRVAFDRLGQALVVWQRQPTADPAGMTNQIEAFAAGLELAYAVVDVARTNVVAAGLLTANDECDFGPALDAGATGELLLTWGRTRGLFFGGDAQDPARLHAAFWDGTHWTPPEIVATNLTGLYGWRSACGTGGRAAVAFTADRDGAFDTAGDRDIVLVQRTNGVWSAPRPVTAAPGAVSSPVPTFTEDGALALGWLQGAQVLGLLGDLTARPQVWIPTNDFVGLSFSHARLVARDRRLFAVWPAASDLYAVEIPLGTNDAPAFPFPRQPRALRPDLGDVETAFAADLDADGSLRYAAVAAPVTTTTRLPELAPISTAWSERLRFPPAAGTAPRFRTLAFAANGRVVLTWEGAVGTTYLLEHSADLSVWTGVAEQPATGVESRLELEAPSEVRARFFRLKAK